MTEQDLIALNCIAEAEPGAIRPEVYRGGLIKAIAALEWMVGERDEYQRQYHMQRDRAEKAEAEERGLRSAVAALMDRAERAEADLAAARAALQQCRDAFEYTRQYIGYDRLPAIEGWSWYDADKAAEAAIAAARVEGGE